MSFRGSGSAAADGSGQRLLTVLQLDSEYPAGVQQAVHDGTLGACRLARGWHMDLHAGRGAGCVHRVCGCCSTGFQEQCQAGAGQGLEEGARPSGWTHPGGHPWGIYSGAWRACRGTATAA